MPARRILLLALVAAVLVAAVLAWQWPRQQGSLRPDGMLWIHSGASLDMLRFFESDGKTWVEIRSCLERREREVILDREQIVFVNLNTAQRYRFPSRSELASFENDEWEVWVLIEGDGPITPGLYQKTDFELIDCSVDP